MTAALVEYGGGRPPAAPWMFKRCLAALGNGLEGRGTTRPADDTQIALLGKRAVILRAALLAGPMSQIKLAVALLLSRWYPGRAIERPRADAIVHNYALVLEPLPAWSVECAGLRLARGEVIGVNPDFPPSAARVYREARDEITPYRAELDQIEQIERATRWTLSMRNGAST